jgi:hypothetical protein
MDEDKDAVEDVDKDEDKDEDKVEEEIKAVALVLAVFAYAQNVVRK